MAIRIDISISKRLPIPGVDYSSRQAAITISGEITDLTQINAEAARLFTAGETVVDRQLNLLPTAQVPPLVPGIPPTIPPSSPSPTIQPAADTAARSTRPYTNRSRTPAPVTASQLRFLDKLIRDTRTDPNAILHEFAIGSMAGLSCRDAARLIDDLKAKSSAR